MKPLEELAIEFTHFSLSTFKGATPQSSLTKLAGEIEEVVYDLQHGGEGIAEEYADCLMCIFDSAARAGLSVGQLHEAFAKKLEKNKARTWVKNPDNTYSHVKPAQP